MKEKNENSTFIYMNWAESRLDNSFMTWDCKDSCTWLR